MDQSYVFVTPTPETHRRYLARRPDATAESLRDVFGWNMPFHPTMLPSAIWAMLSDAGVVERSGQHFRSKVRFGTLDGLAYVHSSYPTVDSDSVFFGPDTYRFADFIERGLRARAAPLHRVIDVGCGAGAGGLIAAQHGASTGNAAPSLELVDINDRALELAKVNAMTFGISNVTFRNADLFGGTTPGLDLIVANPPYLVDDHERLYRHGGGALGEGLAVRIVLEGLPLLAPGGGLALYTGAPVLQGVDLFRQSIDDRIDPAKFAVAYRELDPDVFGEELDRPAYQDVERIAAVGLWVQRR